MLSFTCFQTYSLRSCHWKLYWAANSVVK